ncbi:MAG: BrnA antitoxin family protein [Phycisphaerales bacterium]|nr:BrnA antitoxin family protein [Phycisphaerales bacterium]
MKKEYAFRGARRGPVVAAAKQRITIRLDPDVVEWFRAQAAAGGSYQAMMNAALREHIERKEGRGLDEETLRRVLREELKAVAG